MGQEAFPKEEKLEDRISRVLGEYSETWLRSELASLGGRRPIDILQGRDEDALYELRNIISEIEYPGFS